MSFSHESYPIASMYGIFAYIYPNKNQPNVGRYTIHGCYQRNTTSTTSASTFQGLYAIGFGEPCRRFHWTTPSFIDPIHPVSHQRCENDFDWKP